MALIGVFDIWCLRARFLSLSISLVLYVVCIQGIPNDNDRRLSQYDANYSLPSFCEEKQLKNLSAALTVELRASGDQVLVVVFGVLQSYNQKQRFSYLSSSFTRTPFSNVFY